MDSEQNISVHLPSEYFDILSEVIAIGLDRAKMTPQIRNELKAWWTAESGFVLETHYCRQYKPPPKQGFNLL